MRRFVPGQRVGDFVQDHVADRRLIVAGDEMCRQLDPPLGVAAESQASLPPIEAKFPARKPVPLHQPPGQILGIHQSHARTLFDMRHGNKDE